MADISTRNDKVSKIGVSSKKSPQCTDKTVPSIGKPVDVRKSSKISTASGGEQMGNPKRKGK